MMMNILPKIAVFKYHLQVLFMMLQVAFGYGQAEENKKPNAPFPIELTFGDNNINFQAIFQSGFKGSEKFGFFNLSTAFVDYDKQFNREEVLTAKSLVTYKLRKQLSATAGIQFHSLKGFVPAAGLQYLYADSRWLLVIFPSALFLPYLTLEGVFIAEYKPRLFEKIDVYSRLQMLYEYNAEDKLHDRSFIYLRLGVSRLNFSYGLALNFDYYGPDKRQEENFGVFLQYRFLR
ncbi:hypothetical protein [Maribacter sp. 2307ULW6-5]|uniref:hypothetical protein n=1 Tax=Maribacter sp. 2307ULW6-5 TaxID=3386275 RepID=UPI0039BCAA73